MTFKVGDRVRVITTVDGLKLKGETGTVLGFSLGSPPMLVEFDKQFPQGHNGGSGTLGSIGRQGHCWYCYEKEFELLTVENKQKTMLQKLTSALKRALSSDLQTLYRAGFIDGNLEMTKEGRAALRDITFVVYQSDMVKRAQEVIDEAEKEAENA